MTIGAINIAFCFNSEAEAKTLGVKLNAISPEINFISSSTFDGFLKAIAQAEKIDFFIIEENFQQCLAADLIEKLQASQRYKKSLIALYSQDRNDLDRKFLEFNLAFIFDSKAEIYEIHEGLEKSLNKNLLPIIPTIFNVLAVDDDALILELISMNINEIGHQNIDLCQNVQDAKALLLKNDYDLILLDWNLSDGSCMDIMDYIKNYPVSPRTKAALSVVITGRNSVDDIMTLLQYGVKDTIIKPFEFHEFVDKITYAVERHLKKPQLR